MPRFVHRHRVWYHGSPYELSELATGSTITTHRGLARAFSHKPTLLCIADDGAIRHNGAQAGILYRIDEPLEADDIYPHPRSTMAEGLEWLTSRPLRLRRLGPSRIRWSERLTQAEVEAWRSVLSDREGNLINDKADGSEEMGRDRDDRRGK